MRRKLTPAERKSIVARLWQKTLVDRNTGCWVWAGVVNSSGYGLLSVRGRAVSPSRLMLWFAYGRLVPEILACHRCDNPPCWNPEHLFPGTAKDNSNDKINKGRTRLFRDRLGPGSDAYFHRMYFFLRMPLHKIAAIHLLHHSVIDAAIQRHEKRLTYAQYAASLAMDNDMSRRRAG